MTRSITFKAIIGSLGLVLLLPFQNCSKVTSGLLIHDNGLAVDQQNTQVTPPVTSANGGIDIPAMPQAGDDQADPTSPSGTTPPVVKNPPTTTPPSNGGVVPPNIPTIPIETCALRPEPVIDHATELACASGESKEHKNNSSAVKSGHKDDKDDDDDAKEPEENGHGLKYCKDENTDTGKVDDNKEIEQIVLLCKQRTDLTPSKILSVDGFHGQIASEVEHVTLITNVYGSLFLKAADASSSIDMISKIRASNKFKTDRTIVICGFKSVSLIENVRGHIILVDSHVTELNDHVGRLTLVNSKIDRIERHFDK